MTISKPIHCWVILLASLVAWPSAYAATPKVAAGMAHTVFLKNDGTVWACGSNSRGPLGDGTVTDRRTPVQTAWLAGTSDISAGSYHTLALRGDGTVWAWGWNNNGQLGDGTWYDRHAPVRVSGLTNAVAVSGGEVHSMALKSDGTVWAWGGNNTGQLGNGTTNDRTYPVQVSGLTDVQAISGRYYHSVALKTDGTVWAWGWNNSGQLGDGTTTNRTAPVQVDGLTNVTAVATGYYHTVALKNDGTVWAWGGNVNGQLGNGTKTASPTPVQVAGLANVVAIAAGYYHTLAIKGDGTVWAWGWNNNGQFGDGTTTDRPTPIQVSGIIGATGIAAGGFHSVVLKSGGACLAWGFNSGGQLGNDTTVERHTPVQVLNWDGSDNYLSTTALAGGLYHTLSLQSDGTVWAWGYNYNGQLGDGTTNPWISPIKVSTTTDMVALAGGEVHSLALKNDGTVWAWGSNSLGQLGDGSTTDRYDPVPVPSLTGVVALTGGRYHSLTLKNDGTVWAWGWNGYGQLGDGTTTDRRSPVQVPNLTNVVALAGKGAHSIALKDGLIWAWGYNANGQLGDGTTTDRHSPVLLSGVESVVAIAGGWDHYLALKLDGTVWTWGYNAYGQLGDGTQTDRHSPIQVPNLTGVVALAGGQYHSFALKNDGTVWAWGRNDRGQLGDGTQTQRLSPVQVPNLTGVVALAAGYTHSLALKNDGTVWAWGYNGYGQLGDGSLTQRLSPVQVKGPGGSGTLSLRLPVPDAQLSSNVSTTGFTANWSNIPSASAYSFKSGADPGFNADVSGISRTLSGLSAGTLHDFQVRAVINNQYGEYSSPVRLYTAPQDATVTGEPTSPTNQTSASLTVGGTNVTLYKYQVEGGTLSQPTSVATPITLSGLSEGTHTVTVWGGIGDSWQATPTTASWTVDTTPPTLEPLVNILGPGAYTVSTHAEIIIRGVPYYQWSLDGINWSGSISVDTPLTLTGLSDGIHSIYLLGRDAAGNWQTTPTTYTWTIDSTPPTATVTTPPPSITNARDITLNVVAGDVTAYKFAQDNGPYGPETPVGTPINLTGLADGSHTVAIIGRDALANWQSQGSATTYPFTVDTVAPVAVVSGAPDDPTNTTTATLTVSGLGVATYQYKLDNGGWQDETPVATPIALSGLTDGTHTVLVIGRDAAGNLQSADSPTPATWTVDTTAPAAVITGTPDTPTNSRDATFDISGPGVTAYQYKLDSGGYGEAIPVATDIVLTNLPDGGHVLSVIGRDAAGNWQSQDSASTATWVVDTQAPAAALSGVPDSPTNSQTATIRVSGDGVNFYRYQFDGGSYGDEFPVATPIALSGLVDGSHTLSVKGRDLAGNWQQTPTSATWIVDTLVPQAVVSGAPNGATNATSATLTVSGDEVTSYKYRLDTGDYGAQTPASAPITLSGLADGSHTVAVLGRNDAGTWQKTPTTATWTVNTAAPTAVLSGVPASPTNSAAATITVGGTDVIEYQYKLDNDEWSPKASVVSSIGLSGLGNGSHTLAVIGCNSLGTCQSQAAPVTATWTVDTIAPAMPAIPAGSNPSRTPSCRPTLVWSSVVDATAYLLEVADNAGFAHPLVQRTVSGQVSYTLAAAERLTKKGLLFWRVRARDAAGNVSTWASASFTYAPPGVPWLLLLQGEL